MSNGKEVKPGNKVKYLLLGEHTLFLLLTMSPGLLSTWDRSWFSRPILREIPLHPVKAQHLFKGSFQNPNHNHQQIITFLIPDAVNPTTSGTASIPPLHGFIKQSWCGQDIKRKTGWIHSI